MYEEITINWLVQLVERRVLLKHSLDVRMAAFEEIFGTNVVTEDVRRTIEGELAEIEALLEGASDNELRLDCRAHIKSLREDVRRNYSTSDPGVLNEYADGYADGLNEAARELEELL